MLQFVKMEGTGNDYVYFDITEGIENPEFTTEQIRRISDRRFGVGGDGVVVIESSERAEAKMLMWNADGSSSAMCGNALRCVAYLTYLRTGKTEFKIESGSGIHHARILQDESERGGYVEVEIGSPAFNTIQIPFHPEKILSGGTVPSDEDFLSDLPARNDTLGEFRFTPLSLGNPHMVIFRNEVNDLDLDRIGPPLENHKAFPERVNVEFVRLENDGSLTQRTFERGSGETLSCGSGACAVLIASVLTGRGPMKNTIHLRGGDLEVEWQRIGNMNMEDLIENPGDIFLRGPVRIVFHGELKRDWLKEI